MWKILGKSLFLFLLGFIFFLYENYDLKLRRLDDVLYFSFLCLVFLWNLSVVGYKMYLFYIIKKNLDVWDIKIWKKIYFRIEIIYFVRWRKKYVVVDIF